MSITWFLPLLFFFNDTATTEIYTLSLHDALPISPSCSPRTATTSPWSPAVATSSTRSEEHTSELQSPYERVCRLLLEKKKKSGYNRPGGQKREARSRCSRRKNE